MYPSQTQGQAPSQGHSRSRSHGCEGPVREVWEAVFGRAVDGDSDFFELGGDSLRAVQITDGVEQRLQVRPGLWVLFDNPRLADYAAEVDRLLADAGERG